MQKVITVESRNATSGVKETQFPELSKLLDDGYEIKQVITYPAVVHCLLTFVLEKRQRVDPAKIF